MFYVIVFGLSFGAGFQAWRTYPPQEPVTAQSLYVVMIAAVVCSYLAGRLTRRFSGARATATATATADASATSSATNQVQVNLLVPGAAAAQGGIRTPSDSAPWFSGVPVRHELTESDLDGMDLADFAEEHREEA